MRDLIAIDCAGSALGATLDHGTRPIGLLIVAGGTQTRIGAHRGMAALAQAIARAGYPVFRFDRRGVGDSDGEDPGFAAGGPDIAAAAQAFRAACPQVTHIAGFGLCDGASALALHHAAAAIDTLILANPWVVEPDAGLPPPAAIRRRYLDRLLSPGAWWKLVSGGIDYRAALRGLVSISRKRAPGLAADIAGSLGRSAASIDLLIADRDATAIAFDAEYQAAGFRALRTCGRVTVARLDSASHGFANGDEPDWLLQAVLGALRRAESGAPEPSSPPNDI